MLRCEHTSSVGSRGVVDMAASLEAAGVVGSREGYPGG
jgi:hypothetical protein